MINGIWCNATKFPLWFNRELTSRVVPKELVPYTEGDKYLSTKQVPSALILRHAGSTSVGKNRELLLKHGFMLKERERGYAAAERTLLVKRLESGLPSASGELSVFLGDSQSTMDLMNQSPDFIENESDSSGSEASATEVPLTREPQSRVLFRDNSRYRIRYDDPWKIQAGIAFSENEDIKPVLRVWSGDGIRLQDPLPAKLFGPNWDGSHRNRIRFCDIADSNVKLNIIYKHTHWGVALSKLCISQEEVTSTWAKSLRYRINRFLKGKTDPLWSSRQVSALLVDPTKCGNRRARSLRFIELLKTVDGVFTQRYMCYPEEVWTWDRFDMFTLGNIALLIGDEFLDGELTPAGAQVVTSYSLLKRARKWFKSISLRPRLEQALDNIPEDNIWCRQFANVWRRSLAAQGHRRIFLFGVLAQTRGAGTPPPLVLLQSKRDFILTISAEPPKITDTMQLIRREATYRAINALPDFALTGLATKSRVTVTSSASWETTRKEGGTTEQIRRILESVDADAQIPLVDLDSGRIESYRYAEDFNTTGELIFWVCLDHVLRTPPDVLTHAYLTVVKEPGKARSVTKARACLKVVLDTVSKICSEPLAKGIRTSSSGMGAANHGWNFFTSMSNTEMEKEVFSLYDREENPYEGYVERTDTFEDLFAVSTDFKTATDSALHEVGRELGDAWMRKCGIPPVLRGIVQRCCFEPRKVFFRAKGLLEGLGRRSEFEDTNYVDLRRGILMGDPLTKPILHLINIGVRHVGEGLLDPTFYNAFDNGSSAFQKLSRSLA